MKTLILSVNEIRKIVQKVGLDTLMDEMIARLSKTLQKSKFNIHYGLRLVKRTNSL